jgi:hypothetical protein
MATKSSRTPAQEAELKKLRARKAHAETVEPKMADSTVGHDLNEEEEDILKMVRAMTGFGFPSWKRAIVGMLVGIGVGCGITYAGSMIISVIMAGAVATTSYFLALVLAVLTAIIVAYAAMKMSAKAFGYIASSTIDEDYTAVKNKVIGWFKPKPVTA